MSALLCDDCRQKLLEDFQKQPLLLGIPELSPEQYLLDQYAGQAMQGLLASNNNVLLDLGIKQRQRMEKQWNPTQIAKDAWLLAEAMLAERTKRLSTPHGQN